MSSHDPAPVTALQPAGWRTVVVVAGREITVRLRDKAFIGSTLFLLLVVAVATVVPVLLGGQVPELRVAVQGAAATETATRAAALGAQAQDADDDLPPALRLLGAGGIPPADVTVIELEPATDPYRMVQDGDVDAAVLGEDPAALRVLGSEQLRWELDVLVTAAAAQVQVERAAAAEGLTASQVQDLMTSTPPDVVLLDARPAGPVPPQLLVVAFGSLFFLSVLTFGMSIAQSVVEEKQSRVVELLVAAVPVRLLLAGKVLGSTTMAVVQVVVVVGAGLVGASLAGQGAVVGELVRASVWFVVFFLLGFAMLACLWAAAGSLASRVEDLNATTIPMQVLVVATFLASIFTTDPGSVQRLLSYVPLTAPLMMPTRIVLGNAEPWEPVVAALVVAGTAALLVVVGARLYARSVLHTSGRLRATQAWRSDER